MHGSHANLTVGRERSPMNWALILNKKEFYTNLFQYQNNVDGGDIVDTHRFEIFSTDTCATLHHKNRVAMNTLICKNFDDLISENIELKQQTDEGATFFPKRIPEDGAIDWNISATHIYNHIRAVTKPFDGAFTYKQGKKITIWRASVFDSDSLGTQSSDSGIIQQIMSDNSFVVQTQRGTLLIHEYTTDGEVDLCIGDRFESVSFESIYSNIEQRYHHIDGGKEITVDYIKQFYE